MSPNKFDVTGGKQLCLKKLLRLTWTTSKRPGTGVPSDKRSLKTSETMSINGRTLFWPISFMTGVTPRTLDVRLNDASVKAHGVQNGYVLSLRTLTLKLAFDYKVKR